MIHRGSRGASAARFTASAAVSGGAVLMLAGCSILGQTSVPTPTRSPSADRTPHPSGSAKGAEAGEISGSATPRPATPEPESTPVPSPTLTQIAAGTPVAQGDVTSPKGSIHYHYRVVADGDGTFSLQYSGFTSTLPVPVSVTLIDIAPKVGDGLTSHGVGDHQLGGPTTTAATASSAALDGVGPHPTNLGTLVTYSSAPTAGGVPIEIGPNKVLAVNTVTWSIPVRDTNVHPADVGGANPYAYGVVTSTTPSGAPRTYLVAHGDTTAMVAKRFGISVQDLIWLNANLEVFGEHQYLYEGTSINLDPDLL